MLNISSLRKADVAVLLCSILAAGFWVTQRDFTLQGRKETVSYAVQTEVKAVPQAKAAVSEVAVPLPAPQITALPIFPPQVIASVLPAYPAAALEKGIEGVAFLQVYVEPSGKASSITVSQSSGNAELDRSALESVKTWIFRAASQGGGAIASYLQIPIRFSLAN